MDLISTNPLRILIISQLPVLSEGLKRLVEDTNLNGITIVADNPDTTQALTELDPDVVILDSPDISVKHLDHLFQQHDKLMKIIVIGWADNKLAVYSRSGVQAATIENLMKAINNHQKEMNSIPPANIERGGC